MNQLALEWLCSLLEKNKVGKLQIVKSLHWKRATIAGECHANAHDFCQVTDRWQPVFGYAINIVGGAQFMMLNHSVVRDNHSGELRNLINCKKSAKGSIMFVSDSLITSHMHDQIGCADDRLRVLLTARFSEPRCITSVNIMPFGRDESSEQDTRRVLLGASLNKDNSVRRWVIASTQLDDATKANVSFSTFYDNAMEGLAVGLPRLVAAAALRKWAREFGVSGGSLIAG